MRKIKHLLQQTLGFVSFTLVIGFSACEEEPSAIDFSDRQPPKDTTYVDPSVSEGAQPKNVLIEDFTGVACPSCPKAHVTISEIQTAYPDRVVAVAIHPAAPLFTNFCTPFNQAPYISKYDFRTEDGKNLFNLVAQPPSQGLPTLVINRKKFDKEPSTAISQVNSCAGYVSKELEAGSPLKLEVKNVTFDNVSHMLTVRVKLTYTQVEGDSNYLTLGLIENDLKDVQKSATVYINEYKHDHILRKLITSVSGDLISVKKLVGRVVEREYSTVLKDDWVVGNMAVYALVHKDAQKLEVMQIVEKKLIP